MPTLPRKSCSQEKHIKIRGAPRKIRRKQSVFVLTVSTVVLMASTVPAEVCYNVTELGTLDGYDIRRPWSINNDGQIVGEVVSSDWFLWRAVLFDNTGGGNNIDLGTLGGETGGAYSINNKGQIVGAADSNDSQQSPHATIFDANEAANNTKLSNESYAWSINDNSQIVGLAVNSSGYERATLFDPNNANNHTELGTLNGFDNSQAYSINNNGQVVGFAYNTIELGMSDYRAVLFDPNHQGNNIDLGTLGGEYSAAISINDKGQIVGFTDTASGLSHATLFDPNGTGNNADLGTIAGFDSSVAASINNRGQIVGQAWEWDYFDFYAAAVLFDPTGDGNNIDLNSLINPALGWTLTSAVCINDNGWIICRGSNPNGYSRSFLLTPIPAGLVDLKPDGHIRFDDFAVLASAWQSKAGDYSWNPACDISDPNDGIIDGRDFSVFVCSWLKGTP